MDNATLESLRVVIQQLQQPVTELSSLLALLAAPLGMLGVLPSQLRQYNTSPLQEDQSKALRYIPTIQRIILESIVPLWEFALAEAGAAAILDTYFCPAQTKNASAVGYVALLSYETILSTPLSDFSIRLLSRLSEEYRVGELYLAINSVERKIKWEDYIRNLLSVPAKVANAVGVGQANTIPDNLNHQAYFNDFCVKFEALIYSQRHSKGVSQ